MLAAHPAYKADGLNKHAQLPHVCVPALLALVKCDDFPPKVDGAGWKDFDKRVWPGSEDQKLAKHGLLERDWHRWQHIMDSKPSAVASMGSAGVMLLAAKEAHEKLTAENLPTEIPTADQWTPSAVRAWAAAGPLKERDFPFFWRLWGVKPQWVQEGHITAYNVSQWTAGINLGLHDGNVTLDEQQILEGAVFGRRVWQDLIHPPNGLKNCELRAGNATALNQLSSIILVDSQHTQTWAGCYAGVESIVLLVAFVYGVQLWWRKKEFQQIVDRDPGLEAAYGQPFIVGGVIQAGNAGGNTNPPPQNPAALV